MSEMKEGYVPKEVAKEGEKTTHASFGLPQSPRRERMFPDSGNVPADYYDIDRLKKWREAEKKVFSEEELNLLQGTDDNTINKLLRIGAMASKASFYPNRINTKEDAIAAGYSEKFLASSEFAEKFAEAFDRLLLSRFIADRPNMSEEKYIRNAARRSREMPIIDFDQLSPVPASDKNFWPIYKDVGGFMLIDEMRRVASVLGVEDVIEKVYRRKIADFDRRRSDWHDDRDR